MTPERLAEIRRIEYHRYGMSGLVAEELINEVDTITAENDRLKGEVEKYKDQSDYLSDRLETVCTAAEVALEKLFQTHTNSGTTFSIPPYGTAQKMADTALNDLKRALGHQV